MAKHHVVDRYSYDAWSAPIASQTSETGRSYIGTTRDGEPIDNRCRGAYYPEAGNFPSSSKCMECEAMSDAAEAAVGYTRVDERGRVSLGKPVRDALGLSAGTIMAYVKVGEAVLLVPQDAHLAQLMAAAVQAFEQAHLSVDEMLAELPHVRDEVVTEHYGAGFLESLEEASAHRPAPPNGR